MNYVRKYLLIRDSEFGAISNYILIAKNTIISHNSFKPQFSVTIWKQFCQQKVVISIYDWYKNGNTNKLFFIDK